MEKERFHYIDVAKGLLIVLVVYSHVYGVMHTNGINNTFANTIHQSCNAFLPFFMPAFFVITGFCSNFKKNFFQFIFQSLKTIILPGITLSLLLNMKSINCESFFSMGKDVLLYGGNYWFLSSLFLAKLLYWFVINKTENAITQFSVITLLFVSGLISNFIYSGREIWWFIHALLLIPFLWVGCMLKKKNVSISGMKITAAYFTVLGTTVFLSHIGVLRIDYFYHVPAITLALININATMIISLIVLSILGSLLTIEISKLISSNKFLEYLGKNSLVVYCIHVPILKFLIQHFAIDGLYYKILPIFFITILICCVVSFVLNLKYIRFIIGKF